MDGSVYPARDVIDAAKKAVFLYANRDTAHGISEIRSGRDKVRTCAAIFGLPCEAHVRGYEQTCTLFFKGPVPTPAHVLCKPDGTELKRRLGPANVRDLVALVDEGAKAVGPGLDADTYEFLTTRLADAKAAVEKEDFKTAVAKLAEMQRKKSPAAERLLAEAGALSERTNELGAKRVAEAKRRLSEGDPEGARKELEEVVATFDPLPCAKEARQALAGLGRK